MSKLDDLIQGIKNIPNANFEYDKQKFKNLMLELIGEDFYDYTPEDLYSGEYDYGNKLKQELRQKVEAL